MALAPTPTTPRPAVRPAAPQPKPKPSSGPLVGLIVAGVLALAGLGAAGFLFSKQGGLSAEIGAHQSSLLSAAAALGIAVDTNTPAAGTDLWSKVTASITAMKNDGERQTVRIDELTQELEAAAGLQATLTKVQGDAQRGAEQVAALNSQLKTLQESSAAQAQEHEAGLAAARKAADDAKAELAALKAAHGEPQADGSTPAPESQPGSESEPAAPATEAPAAEPAPENPQAEAPGAFVFPPRTELLASAAYDAGAEALNIKLRNGTVLRYTQIPQKLFDDLTTIGSHDTYFRMRILGNYPVTPDDKAAVRGKRR